MNNSLNSQQSFSRVEESFKLKTINVIEQNQARMKYGYLEKIFTAYPF